MAGVEASTALCMGLVAAGHVAGAEGGAWRVWACWCCWRVGRWPSAVSAPTAGCGAGAPPALTMHL